LSLPIKLAFSTYLALSLFPIGDAFAVPFTESPVKGCTPVVSRLRHRVIPKWYHGDMAFTVRTDAALEKALESLSRIEGISRQEIIRRAVLERYERSGHHDRVTDATRRMANRWADVLERLGAE